MQPEDERVALGAEPEVWVLAYCQEPTKELPFFREPASAGIFPTAPHPQHLAERLDKAAWASVTFSLKVMKIE